MADPALHTALLLPVAKGKRRRSPLAGGFAFNGGSHREERREENQ